MGKFLGFKPTAMGFIMETHHVMWFQYGFNIVLYG